MDFEALTDEQKEKARMCTTYDELLKLAEGEGIELTDEQLESVSGGWITCETFECETAM